VKIIYTNWFIPKDFDALSLLFVCFIRPSQKGNKALIAHETQHYIQWKKEPFTFPFKYLFNKRYRFHMELEAYRLQLQFYKGKQRKLYLLYFADLLANNYRLDVPKEECVKLLNVKIK